MKRRDPGNEVGRTITDTTQDVLNMSTTVRNYGHLFRVGFVFQTIGDIFLSLTSFASVVKQYIYGTSPQQTTQDVEAFTAETRSLLFLNPNIVAFSEREFQEFHDFTLSCGQPMGTVLVSERIKCRKCDKPLVLEKTSHPVVIYHTYRGTYMGSRLTKHCRTCQIHEHYGQWSIQGQKYSGLQITNRQAPVTLSGQTCLCSGTTPFWSVKF